MQQAVKRLEAAELADVLDLVNEELESLSAKGKVQAFHSVSVSNGRNENKY